MRVLLRLSCTALFTALSACNSSGDAPQLSDQSQDVSSLTPEATSHKGDWPLLKSENPRTVWADGIWIMPAPECNGDELYISSLITNYSDYNMEHNAASLTDLLGPYSWSWSDDPFAEPDAGKGENDIKVIIFRNIISEPTTRYGIVKNADALPRSAAMEMHKTDTKKKLDFRYIAYTDMLDYLDQASIDAPLEGVASSLLKRKFEIKNMFCAEPH